MTAFLNYPLADYGSKIAPHWQNTYTKDDAGKVIQVRGKGRASPFWVVNLTYVRPISDPTTAFEMAVFLDAIRSLQGGLVQCYFYTPSPWDRWTNVAAGTGDGETLVFPFGGSNLALGQMQPVVMINGVASPQLEIEHEGGGPPITYSWSVAPMPEDPMNRWAITFDSSVTPASGAVVTVSFMGMRLLLGNLIADPGEISSPDYARISFTLQLQGEEV